MNELFSGLPVPPGFFKKFARKSVENPGSQEIYKAIDDLMGYSGYTAKQAMDTLYPGVTFSKEFYSLFPRGGKRNKKSKRNKKNKRKSKRNKM
jgi:signal recognition particle subunit SEC65